MQTSQKINIYEELHVNIFKPDSTDTSPEAVLLELETLFPSRDDGAIEICVTNEVFPYITVSSVVSA